MRTRILVTGGLALVVLLPRPIVQSDGDGWLVALSSLLQVLTVLSVGFAFVVIGAAVVRGHKTCYLSGPIGLGASLLVGVGLLGAVLMMLGLLGLFTQVVVLVTTFAAVFLCSGSRTTDFVLSLFKDTRVQLAGIWSEPLARLPVLIGLSGFVYLMLTALGPTTSWDGPMYHVQLPRLFLDEGRIFLPPDNQHVAFVGSPQMANAILLAAGTDSGPALMQWLWFVLAVVLMATAVARWTNPVAGALVVALVWAYPLLPMLGAWDLVDMAMTAAVLVVTLVAIEWLYYREQPGALYLGLLVGATLSTKPQAAAYVVGLAITVLVAARLSKVRLELSSLALGVVFALLAWSPILIKNMTMFGTPLYPLLSDPFVPGWVYEIEPRFEVSSSMQRLLAEVRRPFNLKDWILDPGVLTPEAVGAWYGFPGLFLLGLGSLWTRMRRRVALLAAPAVIGVIVLLLIQSKTNLRYLMPIAPVAVMSLAVLIGSLIARSRVWLKRLAVSAVLLVSLGVASLWLAEVSIPSGRAIASLGFISEEEWLQRPANSSERGAHAIGVELRRLGVSEQEPALLLYEARGALIDAPVLQDNVFQNWPVLSGAVGEDCPTAVSWRLLVRSTATLDYFRQRGAGEDVLLLDKFDEFSRRCLTKLSTVEGYEIFRLTG